MERSRSDDESQALILELTRVGRPADPQAFCFEPQAYTLRGEGGGRSEFRVEWGPALLADLEQLQRPDRDPATVQRVGEVLQGCLRDADWARVEAALAAGRRTVVTLRANAAELYALPWELLALPRSGRQLGRLAQVLLRYEWPDLGGARKPVRRPEGGRILLAWSTAGGRVGEREHEDELRDACRIGHPAGARALDVLARASLAELAATLAAAERTDQPHAVLHLLCCGHSDGPVAHLVLDGPGGPVTVDTDRLQSLLAPFSRSLQLVVLSICEPAGDAPSGDISGLAQALHRAGIQTVVAPRFPLGRASSTRMTAAFYGELLGGPSSVETAFLAARAALATDPTRLEWAALQLHARAADGDATFPVVYRPYRGLLSFQPEHSRFFFGREAEVADLLARLRALTLAGAPRFVVVAGASGTGKSSLVLAGAAPQLIAAGAALAVTRPGNDWREAWSEARARASADADVVLVVDQFEELFTHESDPAWRSAYTRQLWALAQDPGERTAVVVTLRIDFLGRCAELMLDEQGSRLDRVAFDDAHRVLVAHMTRAQLRRVIEAPAARSGLELEPGLTARMVADVEAEPGALPLLEDTLDRLWQARDGARLGQRAYEAEGGVTGALVRRSDELVDGLDAGDRALARRLLVELVAVLDDGHALALRRRVPLAALRPDDRSDEATRFDRLLDLLVRERLLVRDEGKHGPTVEVAHETLIRRWERLRDWVTADQEHLRRAAELQAWVERHDRHGTLLEGKELARAGAVLEMLPPDLGARHEELRARARALMDRSRRRGRLRRLATAAAVVVALAGAALGWQRAADSLQRSRCQAAGASIEELWNDDARAQLRAALLASGVSYAPRTADAVVARLDAHAAAWRRARADTCLDLEVLGIWDDATHERSLGCLDDRRRELAVLVEQLSLADRVVVQSAAPAAASLQAIDACRDRRRLADLPARPEAHQRDAVEQAEADLLRAASMERTGAYEQSRALTLDVRARADAIAWPPLLAATHLRLGLLYEQMADYTAAAAELERAFAVATEAEAVETAIRAANGLIEVVGRRLARHDEGKLWATEVARAVLAIDQGELVEANLLHSLAKVQMDAGELTGARQRFAAALAASGAALGEQHPDTLRIAGNYAVFLSIQGEHEEALRRQEAILASQRESLGDEHPETLATIENMGSTHYRKGELALARQRYEEALAAQERVLGPGHIDTLGTLANLTNVLGDQGEHAEARARLEQVLARAEQTLGKDHPGTILCLANLAELRAAQGDLSAAIEMNARVLAAQEQALHAEHPDLLRSLNRGAVFLSMQGDLAGARKLYERARDAQVRVLGETHPETIATIVNLAIVRSDQGEHAAAIPMLKWAYETRLQQLGKDNLRTIYTLYNLASIELRGGDKVEAQVKLEASVRSLEAALSPEHDDVAMALITLAEAQLANDQVGEAKRGLERALRIREQALGPEHYTVSYALIFLGEAALADGRPADALSLARRAIALLETAETTPTDLAAANFVLARALWSAPGSSRDRGQAMTLAHRTVDALGAVSGNEAMVAKIRAWIAKPG